MYKIKFVYLLLAVIWISDVSVSQAGKIARSPKSEKGHVLILRHILAQMGTQDPRPPGLDSLALLLREQELLGWETFPLTQADADLLYGTLRELVAKAKRHNAIVSFFVRMRLSINKNVELSEFISLALPTVAINNPRSFLRVVRALPDSDRVEIVSGLDAFEAVPDTADQATLEKLIQKLQSAK